MFTSTDPGDPMAMARELREYAMPASSSALWMLATISATTSAALVFGVGWRAWPMTSPVGHHHRLDLRPSQVDASRRLRHRDWSSSVVGQIGAHLAGVAGCLSR